MRLLPALFLHSLPFRSQNPIRHNMAWTCSAASNTALVDNLVKSRLIRTSAVEEAMRRVDRRHFVSPGTSSPYDDTPHLLSCAATISAPHMHAMALELLHPYLTPGARALDIGAGSGYLTACMAVMVGPDGLVAGVEHVPQLKEFAEENIRRFDSLLLESGNIVMQATDGRMGAPDQAPFSAIHVGAAAAAIPDDLVTQLAPNGAMVIPVGTFAQGLVLVKKDSNGNVSEETVCGVRYVPLTDLDHQLNRG